MRMPAQTCRCVRMLVSESYLLTKQPGRTPWLHSSSHHTPQARAHKAAKLLSFCGDAIAEGAIPAPRPLCSERGCSTDSAPLGDRAK